MSEKTPKASRSAPAPRLPRGEVSTATWRDLAVVSVLSALGIWGLAPAFSDNGYLLAGLGGLLVGTAAGYLSHLFRLNAFFTGLSAIVLYFMLGSALAMPGYALFAVLPTLTTLRGLALGAVFGWTDLVTLSAPAGAPEYITVLPYAAAWLVGLVTTVLVLRWLPRHDRSPARLSVLLIGPTALYLLGILYGTSTPFLAGLRGISFAVLALLWLGWRRGGVTNASLQERRGLNRTKLLGSAIVAVAAILVAAVAGSILIPPPESRFVLREEVVPPFDPQDYPSPLSGFRKYTKDLGETDLFSVTGLAASDRVRLAVMDSYDGRLWDVSGAEDQTDGSGSFRLVGDELPAPALLESSGARSVSVSVSGYSGVWLPIVGYPETISLPTEPTDTSQDLRYNAETATTVITSGVDTGYEYSFTTEVQDAFSDQALSNVPVARVELPLVERVPDVVAAKAAEFAGAATTPIDQLRALEQALKINGFLSHGLASDSVPSRAGHGADRIEELFTRNQMIGDEEQFAAAFALMARSLGHPARVVMGFAPKDVKEGETVTVTGDDVTAWVEVPFQGVGWVAFSPTPDEKEIPQDQNPKPKTEPQPQVRQPPRAEKQDDDLLTEVDINDSEEDEKNEDAFALPLWVWILGGALGASLLLYLVPLLVIAAIKRRRMRLRRTAATADARAAGAWDELLDRYAEVGYVLPEIGTRRMFAADLGSQVETEAAQANGTAERADRPGGLATLTRLAHGTDEAVFSGRNLPEKRIDELWQTSVESSTGAASAVGWWRRQLSRFRVHTGRTMTDRLTAPGRGTRSGHKGQRKKTAE
ncbi:transglutaminase domain-containing protein [Mycetocola miduiensis]|uniref:Transglutaminase-like superfamily protein n=1 Tax=Mycetocola miduiensis TaxID=995034 RepID=A0A1I5D2S8_9MICO|nr:transglutaminase domain-containing protein [Mycetocola miduiensis]SFN93443.1 Transglutaminase-like superfamily protein [Mycetocola miduiensis]